MNKKSLIWIIGGVVGVTLLGLMAYAIAGEEPLDPSVAFRPVTVTGSALPPLQGDTDPAAGQIVAEVVGEDWNGNRVAIEPDGRPKVIVFLAHWCAHCRAEVPEIVDWMNDGGVPDDVDFIAVTIMSDRSQVNFPPQTWLERENWDAPTLMDNAQREVQSVYAANATPYFMVLDGENRNMGRTSGRLGASGLDALVAIARAGGSGSS